MEERPVRSVVSDRLTTKRTQSVQSEGFCTAIASLYIGNDDNWSWQRRGRFWSVGDDGLWGGNNRQRHRHRWRVHPLSLAPILAPVRRPIGETPSDPWINSSASCFRLKQDVIRTGDKAQRSYRTIERKQRALPDIKRLKIKAMATRIILK